MITLSEALSNFSGTTNYVAKYTPTGNVLGISQIFDNGTNVGIGTVTPDSKLVIKGTDSTSSNYSLKIDNSASSPLLYVRNDGNVGIGVSGQNQTHIVEIKDNNPPLTTRKIFGIRDSVLDTELLSISRSAFTIKTSPIIFETENITHKFSYGSTNWYSVIYNQNILSLSTLAQPIFSNPFQDIIRFDSKLVILDPTTPPGTNTPLFVPSNRFYVSGDALIQGRTTDTSLLKVLQPSYGSGTISALSAGTYTQINGVGTNFTRCLNVGETITSSGFTLTITQIDNDTSLRATLDPLAIFTGQSYTLQGLTRVNVLNNGNVGIGTSTPSEKLEVNGNIKTAQPSANGAGAWKLGKKVTATVSLVTTDYIEVEIDSVVYKLALVS